jgi:16S rRNA G527 N7-methylase RsmG
LGEPLSTCNTLINLVCSKNLEGSTEKIKLDFVLIRAVFRCKKSSNITNATLLHHAKPLQKLTTEHTNQNQKTDAQHTPNQNPP